MQLFRDCRVTLSPCHHRPLQDQLHGKSRLRLVDVGCWADLRPTWERICGRSPLNVRASWDRSGVHLGGLWGPVWGRSRADLGPIRGRSGADPGWSASPSARLPPEGHRWHTALELMEEMRERRLAPDLISYNAAVKACERGEAPWRARARAPRWAVGRGSGAGADICRGRARRVLPRRGRRARAPGGAPTRRASVTVTHACLCAQASMCTYAIVI